MRRSWSLLLPLGLLPPLCALAGFRRRLTLRTGLAPRAQSAGVIRRILGIGACVAGTGLAQAAMIAIWVLYELYELDMSSI